MRAHGLEAGPTQRPVLTGALSGAVGGVLGAALLVGSDALSSLAQALRVRPATAAVLFVAVLVVCGMLYGRIFRRAANDRHGGWLFGIGYAYLLWLLGPVALLPLRGHASALVGKAGLILLGAFLVYGLALGLLFPWVHRGLEIQLADAETRHLYGRRER